MDFQQEHGKGDLADCLEIMGEEVAQEQNKPQNNSRSGSKFYLIDVNFPIKGTLFCAGCIGKIASPLKKIVQRKINRKASPLQMFPLPLNNSEAEQEKQARHPIFNPEPCSFEYCLSKYIKSM